MSTIECEMCGAQHLQCDLCDPIWFTRFCMWHCKKTEMFAKIAWAIAEAKQILHGTLFDKNGCDYATSTSRNSERLVVARSLQQDRMAREAASAAASYATKARATARTAATHKARAAAARVGLEIAASATAYKTRSVLWWSLLLLLFLLLLLPLLDTMVMQLLFGKAEMTVQHQ